MGSSAMRLVNMILQVILVRCKLLCVDAPAINPLYSTEENTAYQNNQTQTARTLLEDDVMYSNGICCIKCHMRMALSGTHVDYALCQDTIGKMWQWTASVYC